MNNLTLAMFRALTTLTETPEARITASHKPGIRFYALRFMNVPEPVPPISKQTWNGMLQRGLIQKEWDSETNTEYRITEAGRKALEAEK